MKTSRKYLNDTDGELITNLMGMPFKGQVSEAFIKSVDNKIYKMVAHVVYTKHHASAEAQSNILHSGAMFVKPVSRW